MGRPKVPFPRPPALPRQLPTPLGTVLGMTSEEMSNAERARRDYLELNEIEVGVAREFLRSEGPAFALDSRLTELDAQRRNALDQMNAALELMGMTPFPWMSRDDLLLFLRKGEAIPLPPPPNEEG